MSNFIELCISGEALLEDIDDYIDEWHESDTDQPIYEYLGMTKNEYSCYVASSDILPYIVLTHKKHQNFDKVVANIPEYQHSIAARSSDMEKAKALIAHLQKQH